jgi:Flp pilus assembly protein TadB
VTAHWLVAATCLVAAAVVLGWPQRSRPARLLAASRPEGRSLRARVEALSGPRAMILTIALAALAGTLVAGPVAGVVAGGYGAIAVRSILRRRTSRATAAMRTRSLDALCGLAADLRAGLPAGAAPVGAALAGSADPGPPLAGSMRMHSLQTGATSGGRSGSTDPATGPAGIEDRRMAQLAGAAWRLAERTGAPIADLVERIEADARATDRADASAAAQAAGARATAWLLAGLPVGGIALGYTIGADPLAVLLHTPIGAACATGAIALQVAGLTWADRIASAGTARPEPAPPPAQAPAELPETAQAPTAPAAHAPPMASGAAPALTVPQRPTSAHASTLQAGIAAAPDPLWTATRATTRRPPSAAQAHTDGADAARGAVRPKPHPLPRAAASRSGAVVADQSGPGSDA